MTTTLRLFDWGPSPFCMKVRAILEYKDLAYERVNVLGRPLVELYRRGRIGKVPALEIEGELVCDSTDIAHELERRFPQKPILPTARRELGLCHALEDWADESLYYVGLYFQWIDPAGAPLVNEVFHRVPVVGAVTLPIYRRVIERQIRGQGTGRKPRAHIAADLERHLDALESLLEARAFLLADTPMLCDFAVTAQLHYLSRTPHGRRALEPRAALERYADRMRSHRRPTAAGQ